MSDEAMKLLAEQHAAMGDIMMLRRMSATPEQRATVEAAIAIWWKVEAFLSPPHPRAKILFRWALTSTGERRHEFLQGDGTWKRCAGPRFCRECNRLRDAAVAARGKR